MNGTVNWHCQPFIELFWIGDRAIFFSIYATKGSQMNWLIICLVFINISISSYSKSDFDLPKMEIRQLLPTQSSVGEAAVAVKKDMLTQLNEEQFDDYLKKHPVPVILAPNGKYYLVDHHHLCTALLQLNVKKTYVDVWDLSQFENGKKKSVKLVKNNSKSGDKLDKAKSSKEKKPLAQIDQTEEQKMDEFWRQMKENNFVYLKKQDGSEINPKDLPRRIEELQDDPFRSFAYFFRDFGGYDKVSIPFLEFMWGDFLRKKMSLEEIKMPMTVAELTKMQAVLRSGRPLDLSNEIQKSLLPFYNKVVEALVHVNSSEAAGLPGSKYKENSCYKYY